MACNPDEKEIEALLKADGRRRYEYFIKRVCDSRMVWGLNSDGWASLGEGDRRFLPLWPHEAYAERFKQGDWSAYAPKAIELLHFLEVWLPGMKANGVEPAVFPVGTGDSIFVKPDELGAHLRTELLEAYAEGR